MLDFAAVPQGLLLPGRRTSPFGAATLTWTGTTPPFGRFSAATLFCGRR